MDFAVYCGCRELCLPSLRVVMGITVIATVIIVVATVTTVVSKVTTDIATVTTVVVITISVSGVQSRAPSTSGD